MRLLFSLSMIVILMMIAGQASGARHALLIGCSDYETQRDLPGCGNDVALLRERLLTPRFGFTTSNLTVLSDVAPAATRPTYKNICAAFELIVKGDWATDPESDMLLIYLAGHGGQRKSDSDTEKDGMDEYFLPVDESDVILDDQIGLWIDQLNQKDIHVWIVFDSCFSGTMMRGDHPDETIRGVPSKGNHVARSNQHVTLDLPVSLSGSKANYAAFYACQAHEKAIEDRTLDTSSGKPVSHGLFSYCLLQCLDQASDGESMLTYEDLFRQIIDRYRSLGRSWPTPFYEGNLEQQVLGFTKWPKSNPLFLTNDGSEVGMVGGQLAGVTKNAIIAIYAAKDRKQSEPIGYVQVDEVSATNAEIHSVAYEKFHKAVPLTQFPNNATCRIVSQEIGELRIGLSVVEPGRSVPELSANHAPLLKAIKDKATEPVSIFSVLKDRGSQGWSLLLADQGARLLVPNSLVLTNGDKVPTTEQLNMTPHATYSNTLTPVEIAVMVENDLRKIYNWKNLQRLASAYGESSVELHEVKLEMKKIGGDLSTDDIKHGDTLRFQIINESAYDCAYAVFFLTGRFAIKHEGSGFVKPRENIFRPTKYHLFDVTINKKMAGKNGLVLIGIPQQGNVKHQLSYGGLAQASLGVVAARQRGFAPVTCFEKQLYQATFGNQKFRAGGSDEQPQMSTITWVVSE